MRNTSKAETSGASKSTAKSSKPSNRRKVWQRTGVDGQPEPTIDYMDHSPVHQPHIRLFKTIQNGSRDSGIHVNGQYKFGVERLVELCWEGPQALDVRDQSVMLSLCQLGATADKRMKIMPGSSDWAEISDLIKSTGQGSTLPLIAMVLTAAKIAKAIGLNDSGSNSRSVEASLQRLSTVTMTRTVPDLVGEANMQSSGQSQLIGMKPLDGRSILVVLNAELSHRCEDHKGVVWVNMREQRAIASQVGKRLHAHLCSWASSDEVKTTGLAKLPAHVYGTDQCSVSAMKCRVSAIRCAIGEVAALPGWYCLIDEAKQQLRVRKPIFAGSTSAMTPSNAAITASTAAMTPSTPAKTELTARRKRNAGADFQGVAASL